MLTPEEETALGYRILKGDKEAINEMIIHNLRYVVRIAKFYMNYNVPFEDLISEGNLGLIEAVHRFDVTKGFRFSTYAKSWIAERIQEAIANSSSNVRFPKYAFENLVKYQKLKAKLTQKLNREPTDIELAQELNIDLKRIIQYETLLKPALSLNYIQDKDEPTEFDYFIQSNDRNVEDELIISELPSEIKKLFEALELDDIDIDVLVKRYDLDGKGIKTYREIGDIYNRTRAWAQQREAKVLAKIKRSKYFKDNF